METPTYQSSLRTCFSAWLRGHRFCPSQGSHRECRHWMCPFSAVRSAACKVSPTSQPSHLSKFSAGSPIAKRKACYLWPVENCRVLLTGESKTPGPMNFCILLVGHAQSIFEWFVQVLHDSPHSRHHRCLLHGTLFRPYAIFSSRLEPFVCWVPVFADRHNLRSKGCTSASWYPVQSIPYTFHSSTWTSCQRLVAR